MRPGTRILIIVLFALIGVAAVFQYLAGQKDVRYPGPVKGTPFPTASATASATPSASASPP
jgi:hypothetical protein